MKSKPLVFVLLAFLMVAVSCNVEKRLYRNGWYIEKHNHGPFTAANQTFAGSSVEISQQKIFAAGQANDSIKPEPKSISNTSAAEKISKPVEKLKAKLQDDPHPKKMTNAQARKAIADKGGEPDSMATTLYTMSLLSVFTLLFGVGLILGIITLVISVFTIRRIKMEGGPFAAENIAIIKSARRICWGVIAFGIVALSLLLLSLYLFINAVFAWE
jgi:hypothetical protein